MENEGFYVGYLMNKSSSCHVLFHILKWVTHWLFEVDCQGLSLSPTTDPASILSFGSMTRTSVSFPAKISNIPYPTGYFFNKKMHLFAYCEDPWASPREALWSTVWHAQALRGWVVFIVHDNTTHGHFQAFWIFRTNYLLGNSWLWSMKIQVHK